MEEILNPAGIVTCAACGRDRYRNDTERVGLIRKCHQCLKVEKQASEICWACGVLLDCPLCSAKKRGEAAQ